MGCWATMDSAGRLQSLPSTMAPTATTLTIEPDVARSPGTNKQVYYGDMRGAGASFTLQGILLMQTETESRLMLELYRRQLANAVAVVRIEFNGFGWKLPLSVSAAVRAWVSAAVMSVNARQVSFTFGFAVESWSYQDLYGYNEIRSTSVSTPLIPAGTYSDVLLNTDGLTEIKRVVSTSPVFVRLYHARADRETNLQINAYFGQAVTDAGGYVSVSVPARDDYMYARVYNDSAFPVVAVISMDYTQYSPVRTNGDSMVIEKLSPTYGVSVTPDRINVYRDTPLDFQVVRTMSSRGLTYNIVTNKLEVTNG